MPGRMDFVVADAVPPNRSPRRKFPASRENAGNFADSAENDLANALIVHRFSQEFPTWRAGNSCAELTSCREIAFASREFLTRLFEGRQGTVARRRILCSLPLIRATPSALSRMTMGLLDVARAPHRANAAPAAAAARLALGLTTARAHVTRVDS